MESSLPTLFNSLFDRRFSIVNACLDMHETNYMQHYAPCSWCHQTVTTALNEPMGNRHPSSSC